MIYFTITLMALAVATIILFPLWLRSADKPLGWGLESDDDTAAWVDQKNRLAQQMAELDLALSQNKIEQSTYELEKTELAKDGETVLKALQGARSTTTPSSQSHVRRTYPILGLVCGMTFVLAATGFAAFLGNQHLSRNVSPHANMKLPIQSEMKKSIKIAKTEKTQKLKKVDPHSKNGQPILGTDGKPDIKAMVARMEEKVKKPDAPLKDIMMLARSYDVLGQNDKSVKVYQRAIAMAPDNQSVLMVAGQVMTKSNNKTIQMDGEKLFDKILIAKPDFPEAMWLKSLSLMKRHKMKEAIALLLKVKPLIEDNPKAMNAVRGLLSHLEKTSQAPVTVPQNK